LKAYELIKTDFHIVFIFGDDCSDRFVRQGLNSCLNLKSEFYPKEENKKWLRAQSHVTYIKGEYNEN